MAVRHPKGGVARETRDLVRQRARGYCEDCGLPCLTGAHVHHRKPRRMGGTVIPGTNLAGNLLWLHPACHARIESRRSESLSTGRLLLAEQDPLTVPVLRWGVWVLLDDEGRVSEPTGSPPVAVR